MKKTVLTRMKRKLCVAYSIYAAVLLISGSELANPISGYSEGWNVSGDLAGWIANTTLTNVDVVDGGGNPDGYLHTFGSVGGSFDIGAFSMLPEVTGDYSGKIWRASFDLLFISGNFDNAWLRFRFQDSTQNGWAYPLTNNFPINQWVPFTVLFDPAWSDSEARAAGWITDMEWDPYAVPLVSWSQTMSNAFTTEIRISGQGYLNAGIDNYSLANAPVPEPTTMLLLGFGLIGLAGLRRGFKK